MRSKGIAVTLAGLAILGTGGRAFGAGRLSVGPYASVTSSKSIKAKKPGSEASEEVTTQRTTYGLRADIRLSKFFSLTGQAGVNKVDRTKKLVAMRDEYGDIDFQSDLNVSPGDQNATFRYQEEQRLGQAKLVLRPLYTSFLWLNVGAGVQARQRLITSTDKATGVSTKTTDKIRYQALASAGLGYKILRAFTGKIEYTFYFTKFPKTQPHEQEVAVNFGVEI